MDIIWTHQHLNLDEWSCPYPKSFLIKHPNRNDNKLTLVQVAKQQRKVKVVRVVLLSLQASINKNVKRRASWFILQCRWLDASQRHGLFLDDNTSWFPLPKGDSWIHFVSVNLSSFDCVTCQALIEFRHPWKLTAGNSCDAAEHDQNNRISFLWSHRCCS